MKHGKRLTVAMKKLLVKNGMNPSNYLYVSNTTKILTVVEVGTNKITIINK